MSSSTITSLKEKYMNLKVDKASDELNLKIKKIANKLNNNIIDLDIIFERIEEINVNKRLERKDWNTL